MGFVDGEDDDFVVGEELELDGLGEGDEVELFAVDGLVIHVIEDGVVLCSGGLGNVSVDSWGGGHVEALGAANEGLIVDADKHAFLIVLFVTLEGGGGAGLVFRPVDLAGFEGEEVDLVVEIGADKFLEVAAFFTLCLGGGAVGGEDALEGSHVWRRLEKMG